MRSNSTARGLLAIVVMALTGCMDLEEEIVSGVTGEFFGTPEGAEAAITGAYSRLREWAGQERQLALFTMGTDSWQTSSQSNVDLPFSEYTNALAANMANPQLRDDWASRYAAVNATNTAIHFIDASSEIPEPTKLVRLGEARFLRALNYFFLVREWGNVPLQLEPTEGVILTGTRTSAEQVYSEAILPDLEYAIDNLPAQQSEVGRATRAAAQMMLAEVYLTRAADGDFDRARDLTTAIIESGQYALNPTYYGLFCGDRYPEACEFVPEKEQNPEWIFSVRYTGDDVTDSGHWFHLQYTAAYDFSGVADPAMPRLVQYGRPWRHLKPTHHLLNLWNRETDSRFDGTFQTVWLYPSGDTAIVMPGTADVPPDYANKAYSVIAESDYTMDVFPSVRKWLDDKRRSASDVVTARDVGVYRLAETYLMRAEANIRAGRPGDAIADINVLRRRAARPGTNNEMTTAELAEFGASPIDFLLDERERELAAEELRWFVLTRTGKLVDRVQDYNPPASGNVQPHHVLRPIPQEQIDRVQGEFGQNPGYN